MHRFLRLIRPALLLTAGLYVSACATRNDALGPPADLGDFRLGYDIVVAKNAEMVPPSRKATPEQWQAILTEELDRRFRRYDGEKLYHFGVNVDGYALALPGIPVVAAPKSILVASANVWDDAAGKKLNAEPKQITVWETVSGDSLVGTGLTMSKEEQMRDLAINLAGQIENWLLENREAWFGYTPGAAAAGAMPAPVSVAPDEGASGAPSIPPQARPARVN